MFPEIFSQKGEIYFRKIEHECLKEVLENSLDVILSLGGGTPCYANNMDLIHQQKAVSIYLRASIATLTDRILKQKASRPLVAFLSDDQVPEFIAKHLFDAAENPRVQGGELFIIYFEDEREGTEKVDKIGIFKMEKRESFLKISPQEDSFVIEKDQGISLSKIDKAALIYNNDKETGYILSVVDNNKNH